MMNSCSLILLLVVVATINNVTNAFVVPGRMVTPSVFRQRVAYFGALSEDEESGDDSSEADITVGESLSPAVPGAVEPVSDPEPEPVSEPVPEPEPEPEEVEASVIEEDTPPAVPSPEPTPTDEPVTPTMEEDVTPSIEGSVDTRTRLEPGRYNDIDYSVAFPSLFKRPAKLDGSHAGDYGFDPLGLTEEYDLYYMQECEIRHARLAMLAVVGWPLSELVAPSWMLRDGCAPSVLNGFNPLTFLFTAAAFGAFGFLEYNTSIRRTAGTKLGDTHLKDMELIWKYGVAGDYDWDPLDLYSSLGDDASGRKGLRTLEIQQGRYAMLGLTYFVLWEAMTHSPIVKSNMFFHPNLALPFLGVAYFAWTQVFQFRPIKEMISDEKIEIEYTKDGEQMIQVFGRLTKGPLDDLAAKVKEVVGDVEVPKELEEVGSTLKSVSKDVSKGTTTALAGIVAGLTLLIATGLGPSGGDNIKAKPPAVKKVVPTAVTTPKKISPAFKAPEFPKLAAPEVSSPPKITAPPKKVLPEVKAPVTPKFTTPEVPKFAAPELPKFSAPELPAPPKKASPEVKAPESPKLATPELPKFAAPELPKFAAPELPKFAAPEVPKFAAPELPKFAAPELPAPPKKASPEVKAPESPKLATPELPKFAAPELPKFAAPELPKFAAPELPKFAVPEVPSTPKINPPPEMIEKKAAAPVIVEKTKTANIDAVIKATPPPAAAVKKVDSNVAARKEAKEQQERRLEETNKRQAELKKEAQERQVRLAEESAKRQAESKAATEASRKASQEKLEASRKAAQERREQAAEEYAKRKAENKPSQEKLEASRKAAQERREQAAEDYAKRKAENKAALENAREEQASRAAQRAAKDEEFAKELKSDTQANFNKRSYFGDSSVMGDSVQGGKLLPKDEVSPEIRDILKQYAK